MRKYLFVIFTMIGFASIAQSIKIKEPDFIGRVVFVNDSVGEGVNIEQSIATQFKTETAGAWIYLTDVYNSTIYYNMIDSIASKTIINKTNNLDFIIRVKDNNLDPNFNVGIIKMNVNLKMNKRFTTLFIESHEKEITAGKNEYIKCNYTKYGTNSYLIHVDNIPLGEYSIITSSDVNLYNSFSIR